MVIEDTNTQEMKQYQKELARITYDLLNHADYAGKLTIWMCVHCGATLIPGEVDWSLKQLETPSTCACPFCGEYFVL